MKINKIVIAYILIGLIFFSYVLARAIKVGATYDEVVTLQEFVPESFCNIMFKARPIANNHILNTALIKILFLFGNESLFLARAPNLVSFLFYLYFSYRLLSRNLFSYYGVGCFILLICNPFMLEFFSLARGYGLSLAFMMGALCFAYDNVREFSVTSLYKSLGFGALAVISILSMIYFELALALVLNTLILLRKDRDVLRNSLTHSILIGVILVSVISVPILRLVNHHGLFYGGARGFYSDTLLSLVRYTLGNFEPSFVAPFLLNSFLVVVISTIVFSCIKKWISLMSELFWGVAILSISTIVLAHMVARVKYPIDRVSLFLYPLIILSFCFCLCNLGRWISASLLTALVLSFSFNFISRANFCKTTLWDFDSHTSRILEAINNRGRAEGRVVSLGLDFIFKRSVSYYMGNVRYGFVRILYDRDDAKEQPDYYLYLSRDTSPDADFVRHDKNRFPMGLSDENVFIEYPQEKVIVFGSLKGDFPNH